MGTLHAEEVKAEKSTLSSSLVHAPARDRMEEISILDELCIDLTNSAHNSASLLDFAFSTGDSGTAMENQTYNPAVLTGGRHQPPSIQLACVPAQDDAGFQFVAPDASQISLKSSLSKPKQRAVRVSCPYCGGHAIGLGGAKRAEKYSYACTEDACRQRWNQRRTPDENGDYFITPSSRAMGNEPRRSGGYACGKCAEPSPRMDIFARTSTACPF